MKKLLALMLALMLVLSLAACREESNHLSQDKLRGTWSAEFTFNELLAFCAPQFGAMLGFGDYACLAGGLPATYSVPLLIVFDGTASASAYLDRDIFNAQMQRFSEYLLTEDVLLLVLGLQGSTPEEIDTKLGGMDIATLQSLLQLQLANTDFAQAFAQENGYALRGDYIVLPINGSYTIDGSRLTIGTSYLEYDGTDLLLTENDALTSLGFNLTTAPLRFCRVSDQTEY